MRGKRWLSMLWQATLNGLVRKYSLFGRTWLKAICIDWENVVGIHATPLEQLLHEYQSLFKGEIRVIKHLYICLISSCCMSFIKLCSVLPRVLFLIMIRMSL